MKIGYFADGPWSHQALQRLHDDGVEIAFITPRFESQDPFLREWADNHDTPFFVHENVNDQSYLDLISPFGVDLLVSMSFNQILRREIIDLVSMGFINCHAGALPFYRGRNPLNWALINNERSFGVTVHYVDEGIDTGNIITQLSIPITDDDDYGTLLTKAISACPDALLEAVRKLCSGDAAVIRQETIDPVGFYCGMRSEGDEILDWTWTSREIFDFVRAITEPGPGARTVLKSMKEIAVLKTEIIADAPEYKATAGEVVGRTPNGAVVKTGDRTLLITKIADVADDGSLTNHRQPKFRMGTRLGLSHGQLMLGYRALMSKQGETN